jgi:hypothetical protein
LTRGTLDDGNGSARAVTKIKNIVYRLYLTLNMNNKMAEHQVFLIKSSDLTLNIIKCYQLMTINKKIPSGLMLFERVQRLSPSLIYVDMKNILKLLSLGLF